MTITARNYAAQAAMGLDYLASICNESVPKGRDQALLARDLSTCIKESIHFAIPTYREAHSMLNGGQLQEQLVWLSESDESLNLPYNRITVECDFSPPNKGRSDLTVDRMVVVARQEDGLIYATPVFRTTDKEWNPFFGSFAISCDRSKHFEYASCQTYFEEVKKTWGDEEARKRMLIGNAKSRVALLFLLCAIKHNGARVQTIQKAHPNNARRIKDGRTPFYETKTVVIDTRKPVTITGNTGLSAHHASPRYHDRRGHERVLSSGKVVWVRACKVGDPSNGLITKNYQVV